MIATSETGQIIIGTLSGLSTMLLAYIAATARRGIRKFMGEHRFLLQSNQQLLKESKASNDAVVTIAKDIERRQERADKEHARMQEEIDGLKRRRR